MRNTVDREGIDDPFEIGLQSWVDNAPAGKRDSRIAAMQKMIYARKNKSTSLDLSLLGLSDLPSQIENLTALTELSLINNQLTTLPPEIGKLTALTELSLVDNQLTTLPPEIGKLTALKWLYLGQNKLTTLPSEIGNLKALKELDLFDNRLNTLPESLAENGKLPALEKLFLMGNQLNTFPESLIARGRRFFNLENNLIPPDVARRLSDLARENGVTLRISIYDITRLTTSQEQALTARSPTKSSPDLQVKRRIKKTENPIVSEDFDRKKLQSWVDNAPAGKRDSRIAAMQKMIYARKNKSTSLDLSLLGLSDLPSQIGELILVEWLNLSGNKLTYLPPEMGSLINLTRLNLDLTRLNLVRNELNLPPEIGNLASLEGLNLAANKLTTVSPEIGKLTALQELDLDKNRVTTLPESLLNRGERFFVNFEDNPIPPEEVQRLNDFARTNKAALKISIQNHTQPTTANQQALTATITDKILARSPSETFEKTENPIVSEDFDRKKALPIILIGEIHQDPSACFLLEEAIKMLADKGYGLSLGIDRNFTSEDFTGAYKQGRSETQSEANEWEAALIECEKKYKKAYEEKYGTECNSKEITRKLRNSIRRENNIDIWKSVLEKTETKPTCWFEMPEELFLEKDTIMDPYATAIREYDLCFSESVRNRHKLLLYKNAISERVPISFIDNRDFYGTDLKDIERRDAFMAFELKKNPKPQFVLVGVYHLAGISSNLKKLGIPSICYFPIGLGNIGFEISKSGPGYDFACDNEIKLFDFSKVRENKEARSIFLKEKVVDIMSDIDAKTNLEKIDCYKIEVGATSSVDALNAIMHGEVFSAYLNHDNRTVDAVLQSKDPETKRQVAENLARLNIEFIEKELRDQETYLIVPGINMPEMAIKIDRTVVRNCVAKSLSKEASKATRAP